MTSAERCVSDIACWFPGLPVCSHLKRHLRTSLQSKVNVTSTSEVGNQFMVKGTFYFHILGLPGWTEQKPQAVDLDAVAAPRR